VGYFFRILIIGLVVAVAVLLLKRSFARPRARFEHPPAKPQDDMLRCEYCGVYLPRSEATVQSGRSFCSQDHARLGSRPL